MERLKGLPFAIESPEIMKDSEGRVMLFGNEGDFTFRCAFSAPKKWHEWIGYLNAHGAGNSPEVSSLRNAYRALAYIGQAAPERLNPVAVDLLIAGVRHPDHSIALLAAEGLGFAMREKRFQGLVDSVWGDLRIRRFGGGSSQSYRTSTVPRFMKHFFHSFPGAEQPVTVRSISVSRRTTDLKTFLAEQGVESRNPEIRGRSYLYHNARTGDCFVIKYAHQSHLGGRPQSGEDLVRELQWLEATKKLGLQSCLPKPARDENGRPLLLTIDGREAIAFRVSDDYYRELSSVSDEEFFRGLQFAIHDAAVLARHGIFHTAPLVAFHAQARHLGGTFQRSRDDGRYIPSTDIVFPTLAIGMGDLPNWPDALKHPNIGPGGLRDFEELANLDEIQIPKRITMDPFESVTEHAWERPHLSQQEFMERHNQQAIAQALLFHETYFALHLLVGQRMVTQHDGRKLWQNDRLLAVYADRLFNLHVEGYSTLRQISVEKARETLKRRGDWHRLSRNLAFWMSPAHAPFVYPDANPGGFPRGIFDERTEIVGDEASRFGKCSRGSYDPEFGFSETDEEGRRYLNLGADSGPFPVAESEKLIWGSLF